MSVKKKIASSAVEFDSKLTKGIISGLSALDDIQGLMIEEEKTELIRRPAEGEGQGEPKETGEGLAAVAKTTAAKKAAAMKAVHGADKVKAKAKSGKKPKEKAAAKAGVKAAGSGPSKALAATGKYRLTPDYQAYQEADVLLGCPDAQLEISFFVQREQLQKIRHLLESLGIDTPEQVFNPGFGPHRQLVVPRLALREYSQLLAKGLDLLYEVRFAVGPEVADRQPEEIIATLG